MKANIYRKGLVPATLLLLLSTMAVPSWAEETETKQVVPEKKERVFNYNRRASIRMVDMGVDAPKDRYKVERPSMDRLAEEPKEESIFKSEQKMVAPASLMQQTLPNRKLDPKEEDKKNWLTPSTWSEEGDEEDRSRSIFEQEYDERKKAEEAERSPWDSEEEEMTEEEREEERYRVEEEEEEDRFTLRKNAIEEEDEAEKRLGLLEFKPALERNLYNGEDRDTEGRSSDSASRDAEGYGGDEQLTRMDGRREADLEEDDEVGFSRTALAMGLDKEDGIAGNRSQKMMSEITDKWLGAGNSSSINVPKLEDIMKLPSMGGVSVRPTNPSPAPQRDEIGITGFKPERMGTAGNANLPSARISPSGFNVSGFSPSVSKPSLSRPSTGSFASQPKAPTLSGGGFSTSPMPSMSQGFQTPKPRSSSFGSPYSGTSAGGTTGTVAPRRMQSEMGLGGFKVPKF